MISRHSEQFQAGRWLALLTLLAVTGCSGTASVDQRRKKALEEAGVQDIKGFAIGGEVTVDGQPPDLKQRDAVIVMLNDTAKSDIPVPRRPYIVIRKDKEGHFSMPDVAPAHYVLTFVIFEKHGKRGFIGPDKLNNLYSDPDVNAKKPEFVIDHKSPGKQDYHFDLLVEGKSPVKSPGPNALTTLEEGEVWARKIKKK